MTGLRVEIPDELVDAIAERVLERLGEVTPRSNGDDGWLRGAQAIADYIGCGRDRIYQLRAAGRIDCLEQDGSTLVARRSDLDAWLRNGGGKRP